MQIGFKLFAEAFPPQEMVRQAVRAEQAGFDFVEISDHYHPWLDSHGHSGFAWSILAAMGLVIPNAPALALSRHHEAAGTAAALLGAAQFGIGAAVAPVVGVLGNNELALALVMTTGVVVALLALVTVGRAQVVPSSDGP